MHHVLLAHAANIFHGTQSLAQTKAFLDARIQTGLRHKGERAPGQRPAIGAKHQAVMHRLRCGNAGIGIAHGGHGNEAAFQNQRRFDAEEGGLPHHQVGPFADLNAADLMADAVGDGRVDGVLGHIAFGAKVVVALQVFHGLGPTGLRLQPAALLFHLVGRLPGAQNHLAHAAHGLAVAAHHRYRTQVVQHVFGGNGLFANAAFGKGQVFGNAGVEVVADHEHVHMLIERVHGVGHCRVGGAGQKVGFAHHAQNVRGVTATGAFGVKGAQAPAFGRCNGVFYKAALVQGVRVQGDLNLGFVGNVQAVADGRRCRTPVFVEFEADDARVDLLMQSTR